MSRHSSEPNLHTSHALESQMDRQVRLRMRNLRDMHTVIEAYRSRLDEVLNLPPDVLRQIEQRHFPSPWRLDTLYNAELAKEAASARAWLLSVLDCQDANSLRDQDMRVIRLAVVKQLNGQQGEWNEREMLYIALTDNTLSCCEERFQTAVVVVLHFNLTQRLQDVSRLAGEHLERQQRKAEDNAGLLDTLERVMDRTQSMVVDHFACAVPLSQLGDRSKNAAVGDDDAACCPICRHSYVDLSEFSLDELLADYPVRIKHCGHVVGKSCLEQWMLTPKVDEAKYPHRTCPLCRAKVEGVASPAPPPDLKRHLKYDRQAMEALFELVYGFGMEADDGIHAIEACMSEEIACMELLAELERKGGDEEYEWELENKLEDLVMEKRIWGFRGDGVWARLRREWMDSGVVRRA